MVIIYQWYILNINSSPNIHHFPIGSMVNPESPPGQRRQRRHGDTLAIHLTHDVAKI